MDYVYEDGSPVPDTVESDCGSTGTFDLNSGIGYHCDTCGAVLGSVGMPRECQEAYKKKKMWRVLSGKQTN